MEWNDTEVMSQINSRAEIINGHRVLSLDNIKDLVFDARFPKQAFGNGIEVIKAVEAIEAKIKAAPD
jgi:hypothetical protein